MEETTDTPGLRLFK